MFCMVMQEPHINTCYKHYYYFVCEFDLIEKKELEPLVGSSVYFVACLSTFSVKLCTDFCMQSFTVLSCFIL